MPARCSWSTHALHRDGHRDRQLQRHRLGFAGRRQLHRRVRQPGGAGSDTVVIDTANPTVTVDIVDGALNDGDNSSVVTFAFSEAPGASFTESDIQVSAGLTLDAGSLTWSTPRIYTATFTATTASPAPARCRWRPAATPTRPSTWAARAPTPSRIDTENPTVTVDIVDGALSDGDNSSVVTFTFSEAPGASFTESDIQVSAGLTLDAGSLTMVDPRITPRRSPPTDGFTGTGTVSLAAGSYTDAIRSTPAAAGSDTVAIDTANPTALPRSGT